MTYKFGNIEDTYRANIVIEFGAKGDGIADDTAAINNALNSGSPQVFFAPGTYFIGGAINANNNDISLHFDNEAKLKFSNDGLAKFNINGDRIKITGSPSILFDGYCSTNYVPVDLHGNDITCSNIFFELNNDIPNATVMRISGDRCKTDEIYITGVGSAKNLVQLSRQDGYNIKFADIGRINWKHIDDGYTTRNYDNILDMRSVDSVINGIVVVTNGRQNINTIINHRGSRNIIKNPQIDSELANFGFYGNDFSEFVEIFGGFFHQSYGVSFESGTEGVRVGHLAGQIKLYGTKIVGWDVGMRLTGSADTVELYGAVIANNNTANLQIDTHRIEGDWPASGLGLYGVYMESQAVHACIPIHFKSGSVPGMNISSCYIGSYTTLMTFDGYYGGFAHINCSGNRFGTIGGQYLANPTSSTRIYLNNNFIDAALFGTGSFPDNVVNCYAPVLSSLVVGTRDTAGNSGNTLTSIKTDVYTLNFGNLNAGQSLALSFFYSGIAINSTILNVTLLTGLTAKMSDGIQFSWGIDSENHFTVIATNTSGITVNSITGNARITITVTS